MGRFYSFSSVIDLESGDIFNPVLPIFRPIFTPSIGTRDLVGDT